MARVAHQKSAKQAGPSSGARGSKVSKQRKNHKVVIESDAQGKDEKSRAVLSFHAEPPAGYTFIPAGNPQLTAALKEFAKKGNHQILAVTTTPHASRHELSREVHRIGFHFPTEVVSQVCNHYGIRLTSGGKLVEEKDDDKLFMRLYQKGQLALDEQVRDQVTINTEAKQIIQDLFPNIPDNDLFQIIKTAFQLGDGKVGTADEIPLVRRAQLSVVAHIRHTYTNYDKLLRAVPYSEARHRVESITLQKLIDWRGDVQDDKQAMDDTLREVVVISDEESDEVEEGQVLEHQDLRVQPVNGSKRANDIGSGRARSPIEVHSDDEAPQGYRFVPQVVRRYPIQDPQAILVARQQSRYAVWDRVRQEYRSGNAPPQPHVVERIVLDEPPVTSAQVSYVTREPVYVPEPPVRRIVEPAARMVPQPNPPTYVRGADGKVYERITTNPEPAATAASIRRMYTPPPAEPRRQYVDTRQPSPRPPIPRLHQRTDSFDNDGSVLPSIESPGGIYPTSATRRNPFDDPRPILTKRNSGAYEQAQRPAPIIDLTRSAENASKRRRIGDTPPSPYLMRQNERVPNGYDREEARPETSHRLGETKVPSTQQRLIPLDNPATGFDRPNTYERPVSRMQPPVYREEITNREMLPPRATDARHLPTHDAREIYYVQAPRRAEYLTGYDRQTAQPYSDSARQYIAEEPINGATDRISRVILDDAPLQRQPNGLRMEPMTRFVHPETHIVSQAPMQAQYYVQELPPAHYPKEYGSSIGPPYPPAYRDGHVMQYQGDVVLQNSLRAQQPQPTAYR